MSGSAHTAAGQALGYIYQFERATYRLLESDAAVVSVGIEHIDDVSVHKSDGKSISEQDKATINSTNPLTDKSVALWKTLSIWAEALPSDSSGSVNREFHLVTNGAIVRDGLAFRLNRAKTPSQAQSLASELRKVAESLRGELKPYGNRIRKLTLANLTNLVTKIYVFDKVAPAFGGKLEDLQILALLGPLQRTAIFDGALGWVRRTVLAAAQNGEPTVVNRATFLREIRALHRRVAVAPLAIVFGPDEMSIDPANYRSHGFFQQLDWIDVEGFYVRECVIHYAQAMATRVQWTDNGAVSENALRDYEKDLKARWKLNVFRQNDRQYESPLTRGRDLLASTLSEETVLDGQTMPKTITCGSFHVLADFDGSQDPQIGWHPDFEMMAKKSRNK
jgi:hypothetical protein